MPLRRELLLRNSEFAAREKISPYEIVDPLRFNQLEVGLAF